MNEVLHKKNTRLSVLINMKNIHIQLAMFLPFNLSINVLYIMQYMIFHKSKHKNYIIFKLASHVAYNAAVSAYVCTRLNICICTYFAYADRVARRGKAAEARIVTACLNSI